MNTDLKSFSSSHWKSILAIVTATVVTVAVVYSLQAAPVPVLKKKSNKKKRSSLKKVDSVVDVAAPGDTPVEPAVAEKIQEPVPNDQLALVAKAAGNELFSSKNYEEAIVQYSTAISLSPNAIFYCNRAACYSNLGQFESARSDCTEAIKLDSKYIKAFRRKALACESLGDTRAALNEYTAVCALEGFKNKSSMAAPDRLLQVLANDRTKLIMVSKVHSVPSETFVSAYMDSFRATPLDSTIVLALSTAEFASDELLKQTFNSALNRKWQASLESCHEALEVGLFSSDLIKAKALNYRGTIRFLMGQIDEAVQDLEDSLLLDSNSVNSLIKRATLYMEHGDLEKTIEQLSKAEEVNSENPDLYYHRGQVRFLTGDFQGAIDDYRKSVTCEKAEEASVYVHIQMGVALYKLGDVVGAEKKFREAKKNFAESAEVWNYHGEILMDRQSYIDAERSFDKSIEMDPLSPLPYINKAILQLQWKQDSVLAEACCRKAIEIDPLCDIGYTQLAQLLCLQNKLDEAILVYDQAILIARTEAEIMNVVSCQEAAVAQLYVLQNFPEVMSQLRQD